MEDSKKTNVLEDKAGWQVWLDWIVWSSQDPQRISRTLKSLIPVGIFLLGLFNLNFGQDDATQAIDVLMKIVESIGLLISSIFTGYFFIQKLKTPKPK